MQDICLEIGMGEYFVILGATGSGKTVLLETLAGMYVPDQGKIVHDGLEISFLAPEARRIGFVYQDYALFPHLTVKGNILFGLKQRKLAKRTLEEKLEKMLQLFDIAHLLKQYPATLSGGEKQRVALARALVTEPRILLLDEPLSALDPQTKENILPQLRDWHQRLGMLTLHVTHDYKEAALLADRIGIMERGKLEKVGRPAEIFGKSALN